jgi:hypothetical protein
VQGAGHPPVRLRSRGVGSQRLELTRLGRSDQPLLQFLWMAGFGFPDHNVFREGETQPGVPSHHSKTMQCAILFLLEAAYRGPAL